MFYGFRCRSMGVNKVYGLASMLKPKEKQIPAHLPTVENVREWLFRCMDNRENITECKFVIPLPKRESVKPTGPDLSNVEAILEHSDLKAIIGDSPEKERT